MTLAIYCAGGLGKEIIELARSVNVWKEIIFVDDITGAEWHAGAKVFRFDELRGYNDEIEFIIATGEPAVREALYKKIKGAGYKLATIYEPGCCIHPSANIGEGCIFLASAISVDVVIGPNVLFNGRVTIGHDAVIGAHSVLSHACFLGGHAKIGTRVYLAPGAMVKDRVKIGDNAIISLGAIILRHVKERAIMLGNPAERIGFNTEGKVFNMFGI